MIRTSTALLLTLAAGFVVSTFSLGAQSPAPWHFLASGDARNCGDVVAPAIAQTAIKNQAAFYWHLGDLRWGSDIDEDIRHQPEHVRTPMTVSAYVSGAWTDFIENQIVPFGKMPYFIGIGNHELVAPHTRQEFLLQFADWANAPVIREQRLRDDAHDWQVKTYYHWIDRGVDFIFLDNASNDMIDSAQMRWFTRLIERDAADPSIKTIVVGMHKPLPDGFAGDHSMNESLQGIDSGRQVYAALLKAQNDAHKHVYVLASHQHFYMEDIFSTDYLKAHGGVIPGWIVGTAGAQRYPIPTPAPAVARTGVYGSLLGTVQGDGSIAFAFKEVREADIPKPVTDRYGAAFVHWCFAQNTR